MLDNRRASPSVEARMSSDLLTSATTWSLHADRSPAEHRAAFTRFLMPASTESKATSTSRTLLWISVGTGPAGALTGGLTGDVICFFPSCGGVALSVFAGEELRVELARERSGPGAVVIDVPTWTS